MAFSNPSSNQEGIYSYHSTDGHIYLHLTQETSNSNCSFLKIPADVFYKAVSYYKKGGIATVVDFCICKFDSSPTIKLQYKNDYICISQETWNSILKKVEKNVCKKEEKDDRYRP